MILCIETSTDICSVSIVSEGKVVACKESESDFSHSRVLTRFIEDVLAEAGLDSMHGLEAVAISEGPGSYTALRIGASVAKGICFACDIPLIAINSLEILACGLSESGVVGERDVIVPVIDARRMEIYMKVFNHQLIELEKTRAHILDATSFSYLSECETVHIVGNAVPKMQDFLETSNCQYSSLQPSSRYMARIADRRHKDKMYADTVYFEPFYFKSPNITTSKKKLL